eukprot:TRINITY_DN1416_c0_g1_i1.p1 TRINITY_DN1416_c0_g1~~TRINITY_DN1416_c0_g1_i1.p1  ORF type:complete len:659 (+),score=39.86 TRINITY_DN1416_c0_g1_i1:38-2014(+)
MDGERPAESTALEEPECRICRDSSAPEDFVRPCKCKGGLSVVHAECLKRWLGVNPSGRVGCEICGEPYRVTYQKSSNWLSLAHFGANQIFAFLPALVLAPVYGFVCRHFLLSNTPEATLANLGWLWAAVILGTPIAFRIRKLPLILVQFFFGCFVLGTTIAIVALPLLAYFFENAVVDCSLPLRNCFPVSYVTEPICLNTSTPSARQLRRLEWCVFDDDLPYPFRLPRMPTGNVFAFLPARLPWAWAHSALSILTGLFWAVHSLYEESHLYADLYLALCAVRSFQDLITPLRLYQKQAAIMSLFILLPSLLVVLHQSTSVVARVTAHFPLLLALTVLPLCGPEMLMITHCSVMVLAVSYHHVYGWEAAAAVSVVGLLTHLPPLTPFVAELLQGLRSLVRTVAACVPILRKKYVLINVALATPAFFAAWWHSPSISVLGLVLTWARWVLVYHPTIIPTRVWVVLRRDAPEEVENCYANLLRPPVLLGAELNERILTLRELMIETQALEEQLSLVDQLPSSFEAIRGEYVEMRELLEKMRQICRSLGALRREAIQDLLVSPAVMCTWLRCVELLPVLAGVVLCTSELLGVFAAETTKWYTHGSLQLQRGAQTLLGACVLSLISVIGAVVVEVSQYAQTAYARWMARTAITHIHSVSPAGA